MSRKPFSQSFWIREGLLCAGCYPGDRVPSVRDEKLRGLLDCGIELIVSLMEPNETSHDGMPFEPYAARLESMADELGATVQFRQIPVKDASAPTKSVMKQILDALDESVQGNVPVYFHCWGGHGRTSTVTACHLIRHGKTADQAIAQVLRWRAELPKSHFPFEGNQEQFVETWTER